MFLFFFFLHLSISDFKNEKYSSYRNLNMVTEKLGRADIF